MNSEIKDAVMALFEPPEKEAEVPLAVPPDASIEIIICPHCDGGNCEVWNGTEARLATCPDCSAEFIPPVPESSAMNMILGIAEHRKGLLRKLTRLDEKFNPVSDGLVRGLLR